MKEEDNSGLALSLYHAIIEKEWVAYILVEDPCILLEPYTRCIIKIKKLDKPDTLSIII